MKIVVLAEVRECNRPLNKSPLLVSSGADAYIDVCTLAESRRRKRQSSSVFFTEKNVDMHIVCPVSKSRIEVRPT